MLPPNKSPEDVLKPGDELEGSVESILRADRRPAAFVDVPKLNSSAHSWVMSHHPFPEELGQAGES